MDLINKKILIIGLGVYIEAIVLPILKKFFRKHNIYIYAHNPVKSYSFSKRENINLHDDKNEFDFYDFFFLNTPVFDYEYFLKKIPDNKYLWIEKPISLINLNSLNNINRLIINRFRNVYVGFNKRVLVDNFQLNKNESINGKINFHIPFDQQISERNWKHALIDGGIYYVDGIHALDLAFFILGNDAKIKNYSFNKNKWNFIVNADKGFIEVNIGNSVNDLFKINSIECEDFNKYSNSKLFFKICFEKFISGKSNYDNVFKIQKKLVQLFLREKNYYKP